MGLTRTKAAGAFRRWGITVGLCVCVLLFCFLATSLVDRSRDFLGDYTPPFPGAYGLLGSLRLAWTMPLGLAVSLVLLWKTKVCSAKTSFRIDFAAMVVLWLALGLLYWTFLSFRGPMEVLAPG